MGQLSCNISGLSCDRDFHDPNDAKKRSYDGLARPVYLNYAPALSGGQLLGTLTYGYDAVSNETFEHDTNVVGTLTASRRNIEGCSDKAAPCKSCSRRISNLGEFMKAILVAMIASALVLLSMSVSVRSCTY